MKACSVKPRVPSTEYWVLSTEWFREVGRGARHSLDGLCGATLLSTQYSVLRRGNPAGGPPQHVAAADYAYELALTVDDGHAADALLSQLFGHLLQAGGL